MERRCRSLTLGVVVLSAVLATACLSSAMREDPDVLRAKRIELVREDGTVSIHLFAEARSPNGNSLAGILLDAGDGAAGGWTVGRVYQDGAWHGMADLRLDSTNGSGKAGVHLRADTAGAVVCASGGPGHGELASSARQTTLRFLECAPNPVDEDEEPEDTVRVSLELVDGVPTLRAFEKSGETVFEQP